VAVIHYTSEDPRGGSWMTGIGRSKLEAMLVAVRRHERIIGSSPPKGTRVEYYREDKWQSDGVVGKGQGNG